MRIWVGFYDSEFDGCSTPVVAFDNHPAALEWVDNDDGADFSSRVVKMLEMKLSDPLTTQ